MKIDPTTHLLVPQGSEKIFTNKISPNQKALATTDGLPKDLIIHYTACSLEATVAAFMASGGTSAHIVLNTNGDIYQMVPFNRQAFHSGYSVWDANSAFNGRSIGIEIVNFGWDVKKVNAAEIVAATHKHKFIKQKQWHIYPPAQLKSLYALSRVLLEQYDLSRFLGHEDVSAGRKQDPGPAFPWDEYKRTVLGSTNNIGKVFTVRSPDGANLRKADNANSEIIKLLPKGYEVGLIETWNNWSRVYLCNTAEDVVFMEGGVQKNRKVMGWIRSDLIEVKGG